MSDGADTPPVAADRVDLVTTQLPPVLPSYLAALLPRASDISSASKLPTIRTTWRQATFEKPHVDKYRALCSLSMPSSDDETIVPICYPHSFLGPLHLHVMTHRAFPLGILGCVHLRNHIVQHRPLRVGVPYDIALAFGTGRRRPQGVEVDLLTRIEADGAVVWQSVTPIFIRTRKVRSTDPDTIDPESPLAASVGSRIAGNTVPAGDFPVPADTGKAFGWLTKDINPIHMSAHAARLFGFQRDLVHGMWALARALPLLTGVDMGASVRLDCWFKGPIYMERDVRVVRAGGAFEMYSGQNPRPSVVGRIANIETKGPLSRL